MATGNVSIRQAQCGDESAVSSILSEAAEWLHERGIPLWKEGELAPQHIAADVAAGLYYLAEVDGTPVGTLRFQLSDPECWPEDAPGEAAYVHRVAVRRAYAGGEISRQLLQWAVERARALGLQFLRLDCDRARPKLRAVYEKFGFNYHSDRQVGPYLVARYELPVTANSKSSPSIPVDNPQYVSRYSFSEYNPGWPAEFAAEADRLHTFLGDQLVAVHHVGSTSVPGLAAKPVIDMIPLVQRIELMDELASEMVVAGYRIWGEYGIAGRRFFTLDRDGFRTHNLHFFAPGSPEIERHLAFAAYLRSHPDVCREYDALKRQVYARHPADIAAYSEGKDAWIKRVEPLAVQWYREHHL